ncbi:MAG: IS1595 family transposase [Nitrospinae bacterium]|nr:IS1595 family transposase [Nitrospinota bacterium]
MNLIKIFRRFPDHESCIEHLEKVRFGDMPYCPHCGSVKVARKADGERVGRWNCHDCKSSFNVLSKTIFQKTKVDLQKWFLAIGLLLNAKKSISANQLARDLDMTPQTAWYMAMRIRKAMAEEGAALLQGIIEADECYIGGKPRKANKREDDDPKGNKRGRGTSKMPVIGAVERGGNVMARVADNLSGKGILRFIKDAVEPEGSLLITDEYPAYNRAEEIMPHAVINHQIQYAEGYRHTNTIEGFWGLLKRAWYGTHHKYSRKHAEAYIHEACWKYNARNVDDAFSVFLRQAVC